jgi:hypothetical protein
MKENADAPARDPRCRGEAEELLELDREDRRSVSVVPERDVAPAGDRQDVGCVLVELAERAWAEAGAKEWLEGCLAQLREASATGGKHWEEVEERLVVERRNAELGHRAPEEGGAAAEALDIVARIESTVDIGAGGLDQQARRLVVEGGGNLVLFENELVVDDPLPGDHTTGDGVPGSRGLRSDALAGERVEPLALHRARETDPVGAGW